MVTKMYNQVLNFIPGVVIAVQKRWRGILNTRKYQLVVLSTFFDRELAKIQATKKKKKQKVVNQDVKQLVVREYFKLVKTY